MVSLYGPAHCLSVLMRTKGSNTFYGYSIQHNVSCTIEKPAEMQKSKVIRFMRIPVCELGSTIFFQKNFSLPGLMLVLVDFSSRAFYFCDPSWMCITSQSCLVHLRVRQEGGELCSFVVLN
jgi:hypothetical protein